MVHCNLGLFLDLYRIIKFLLTKTELQSSIKLSYYVESMTLTLEMPLIVRILHILLLPEILLMLSSTFSLSYKTYQSG